MLAYVHNLPNMGIDHRLYMGIDQHFLWRFKQHLNGARMRRLMGIHSILNGDMILEISEPFHGKVLGDVIGQQEG